jgi:hypothetical protein
LQPVVVAMQSAFQFLVAPGGPEVLEKSRPIRRLDEIQAQTTCLTNGECAGGS